MNAGTDYLVLCTSIQATFGVKCIRVKETTRKAGTHKMASGIMENPLVLVLILCSEKKESLYLLMFEQLRSELNSLDISNYLYIDL